MQNEFSNRLAQITEVILEEAIDYGRLSEALKKLKALFTEACGLDMSSDEYKKDIYHSTGKAIGTEWAAMCIDDLMRTKRFISGTHKAIREALKQKTGQPVTLLYIGTGPFATLVMPLTTVFSPAELQLILVEVNPMTVESLTNCIAGFGAQPYVKEIISADAAQLKIGNASQIDILLLECLQLALIKEQQVAITYNLLPQLRQDAILVPQAIKLSLCLIDNKKKMALMMGESTESYYKNLQTVFLLDKQEVAANKSNPPQFPKITTPLSQQVKTGFTTLAIATEICVFEDEKLRIDDSGLTMMYKIGRTDELGAATEISTQYVVNEKPGWEIAYS